MKKGERKILMRWITIIAVGVIFLNYANVIDIGMGLPKASTQSFVQTQAVTPSQQTTQPSVAEYCNSSDSVTFQVIALEEFSPGTSIVDDGIDVNVIVNNAIDGSFYNGTSTSDGYDLPVNTTISFIAGKDDDSGTDYYFKYFPNYRINCKDPQKETIKFAREGTLGVTIYNSDGTTENGSASSTDAAKSFQDINAGSVQTNRIRFKQATQYARFGAESSTNKVLCVFDYNSSIFLKVRALSLDGTQVYQTTGIPPTYSSNARADTNAGTQVAIILPDASVANWGEFEFLLETTGTSGLSKVNGQFASNEDFCGGTSNTVNNYFSGRCVGIRATCYDYQIFLNSDNGQVEDNTYNPTNLTDLGASNKDFNVWFD